MGKIAIILGAGASAGAGAPLMATFLDVAQQLLEHGTLGDASKSFERVFEGVKALQTVHSKAQLDIQNIESVFAAFEMAKTLGGFSSYDSEDIDLLISATKVLILKTLEETISYPVDPEKQIFLPPSPYSQLAQFIKTNETTRLGHKVAILTFNYDVAVDFGLHYHGIPVDYALDGVPARSNSVPLLKLHGSINWSRCVECRRVVPWQMGEYFRIFSRIDLSNLRNVRVPIGSQLSHFRHCEKPVESEPFLVPPTWNKTSYQQTITGVWQRAATELRGADSILVFGFSLAPSDDFFKFLYGLGTAGGAPLRRFWVFDPDASGKLEQRFRRLLGPGAEQRFKYYRERFDDAINIVERELKT